LEQVEEEKQNETEQITIMNTSAKKNESQELSLMERLTGRSNANKTDQSQAEMAKEKARIEYNKKVKVAFERKIAMKKDEMSTTENALKVMLLTGSQSPMAREIF